MLCPHLCDLLSLWDGSINFLGVVSVGFDDGAIARHDGRGVTVVLYEDLWKVSGAGPGTVGSPL